MNTSNFKHAVLACSMTLGLAACGGGADGTSTTSGASGATTPLVATGTPSTPGVPGVVPPPVVAGPQMTQLAGSPFRFGNSNGAGADARFGNSLGGAVADDLGNVYVADYPNHVIRRITPDGTVSDYAGKSGVSGSIDGSLTDARLQGPSDIVRNAAGTMYVLERGNNRIRSIATDGQVSFLAGSNYGAVDGTGTNAKFAVPQAMAIAPDGNLYVADTDSHTIRKVTPAGVVTTIAGTANMQGSVDAMGAAARFSSPKGIDVSAAGDIFVSDEGSHTIRRIAPDGMVTTLAGMANSPGSADGIGAAARLYGPRGLAFDAAGKLVVASAYGRTVRRIDIATGAVETLAGSGQRGNADASGTAASFSLPTGVAALPGGDVMVTDAEGVVRRITPAGTVTTVAGAWSAYGKVEATGTAARFNYPQQLAQDASGNVYVADSNNFSVRRITPAGVVTTLAGSGNYGVVDGSGASVKFGSISGITVDAAGNVYVADPSTHTIRMITPAGVVSTLAGSANVIGSADNTGAAASFSGPRAITAAPDGNLYVADTYNNCVRRITPAGVVTSFAGTCGSAAASGVPTDDATGSAAKFAYPKGIAADASGNIYVADDGTSRIRKITTAGVVTTLAGGGGSAGYLDGAGTIALFYNPSQLAVDSNGNVYVTEGYNQVIRKITPAGVVSTVAGVGGMSGDTAGIASALPGLLSTPTGVSVGPLGLVISTGNGVVRVTLAP